MALLDLKTDLKSLTFGDPPYVVKGPNTTPTRGRVNQLQKRIDDLERIAKMLVDRPGARYLTAEGLLQQGNITKKVQNLITDPTTGAMDLLDGVKQTAVSLPSIIASTLAQVPVNGTGTHFIRGFGVGLDTYLEKEQILLQTQEVAGSISIAAAKEQATEGFSQSGSVAPKVVDFRQGVYSFDYTSRDINRESRVNLGNQAGVRDRSNYNIPAPEEVKDLINAIPPFEGEPGDINSYRDFIKFRFVVLRPGQPNTTLFFRAFLDSFQDNYSGDWSTHKYVGRGENFHTYAGFTRNVSFSFKVAAATKDEMKPLYQKLVWLASTTAPTYSDTFMKGTLVEMTIGDYLYRTPGYFTTIDYTWETSYPWEIAFQGPENRAQENQQELPQILNVNCAFTPIHKFVPQTGFYHFITNPAKGPNATFFSEGSYKVAQPKVKQIEEPSGVVQPTPEQQRPQASQISPNINSLGV